MNGSFGDVVIINPSSDDVRVLVPGSVMQEKNATSVSVSADQQYALLFSDIHMIYRHSFNATYYLYNILTKKVYKLDPLQSGGQIQYITWSPTGHSLAFVENYDVYIMLDTNSMPVRLMSDGSDIIDGIPDWVYEEEVLGTNHALWWSHDSLYLCYLSFNESNVKDFRFPHYGLYDNVYTDIYSISYPKPGEPNPTVEVTVVNTFDETQSFKVPAPPKVTNDHLVMRVAWAGNSDLLAVVWMNRVQNISVITLCNASLSVNHCREFHEYQSAAWLDNVPLVFSPTGQYFAMLMSSPDNFTHIALFDTEDKVGIPKFITSGSFAVTSVLKFSADISHLYYVSTENGENMSVARQRHTWSVKATKNHDKQCLSCSTFCNYSNAQFSISGKWYMLACTGPDVPSYTLHNVQTNDVTVLENNSALNKRLKNIVLPQTEFFHVHSDVVPQGFEAAQMLPPTFEHNKKYAVLFEVYGGPGSQKVSESFYLGWRTYLVSNFDLIVIMLDGRGTGYRDNQFMHAIYRQLGRFETEDVVDGARQLKSSLSYMDGNKFAIWGWVNSAIVLRIVTNYMLNMVVIWRVFDVYGGWQWEWRVSSCYCCCTSDVMDILWLDITVNDCLLLCVTRVSCGERFRVH
jgi:dipeptidyl-peptidase-4